MPWNTGARAYAEVKRHYYIVTLLHCRKYLKAPNLVRKLKLFDNSLKLQKMRREQHVPQRDTPFFPENASNIDDSLAVFGLVPSFGCFSGNINRIARADQLRICCLFFVIRPWWLTTQQGNSCFFLARISP